MERKQEVSKAVIQRLPRYYRNICELKAEGVQRISSRALAERMGLTASQIRQDFNCFGGFGQQGYGYNIDKLQEELGTILGLHEGRTAILLGAGNLGRALLNNFDFAASGFRLLCAFDANPELTEKFSAAMKCGTVTRFMISSGSTNRMSLCSRSRAATHRKSRAIWWITACAACGILRVKTCISRGWGCRWKMCICPTA